MRALVSASAHFALTGDGGLWTDNPSLGYPFWARYFDVFDGIDLLVRSQPCQAAPDGWTMASGPGVTAIPLPEFVGPWGFVKNYRGVKRVIAQALADAQAVQLRVPCTIGDMVRRSLETSRPYGVEVVGDPYDSFAPGSVRHKLRPFFRWWCARQLRKQCAGACAAAYVTEQALQRRYPAAPGAYATHFSSIVLPQAAFASTPRRPRVNGSAFNLLLVGTLAQLYKGPDVLLDAVAACVRDGLDLRLRIVGDGKHRGELQARANSLGLNGRACFLGQLTEGDPVRQELDRADLFVLPSHQEGLPRAMIEAMARGLPCVGSTVGGIPELLPIEDMMPPGDAAALARKIREVITAPERMTRMSARNLERAKEYQEDMLRPRRIAFYQHVRSQTSKWLQGRSYS